MKVQINALFISIIVYEMVGLRYGIDASHRCRVKLSVEGPPNGYSRPGPNLLNFQRMFVPAPSTWSFDAAAQETKRMIVEINPFFVTVIVPNEKWSSLLSSILNDSRIVVCSIIWPPNADPRANYHVIWFRHICQRLLACSGIIIW
jgi:hypothetical protein